MDCICCKRCGGSVKCDGTCIDEATSSNLLEKNDITKKNKSVFKMKSADLKRYNQIIDIALECGFCHEYPADNSSIALADNITYCAISRFHSKSGMHINVYNLHFGEYTQAVRESWNGNISKDLELIDYCIDNSAFLVISGTDYMTFREYESQRLLQIIEKRRRSGRSTVLLLKNSKSLIKSGGTFDMTIGLFYNGWEEERRRVEKQLREKRRATE